MRDVKKRNVAGMLALLLGGIGVHRFYLGKTTSGIAYAIFFWTFIPAVIGLVEAVLIFTNSEQAFEAKYPGSPWSGSEVQVTNYSSEPNPDTHVKCPDCRELVFSDARVCKHCNCKLVPIHMKCSQCSELVLSDAKVCKHCRSSLVVPA